MMFSVLDASQPEEAARWQALWATGENREVFAHPEYVRLYADTKTRAMCAVLLLDGGGVLFPFLLRDLSTEPFWTADLPPAMDIITPYGYGGAFRWGCLDTKLASETFWAHFDRWAAENGVVSEFCRFYLTTNILLPYPGEVQFRSQNVVRTLDMSEQELWMDFEHKVRKNVKKAERNGLEVMLDATGERLDEFLDIYRGTMDRRAASETYYFPVEYFSAINRNLHGHFMYFHVLHHERVISTELVLISGDSVYSFLGGTVDDAFELRPNDLLKWAIIRWAKELGKKRFVLGGGFQPEDGIYRYKLGFAPAGAVPFYTGARILSPRLYEVAIKSREYHERTTGKEWTPRVGFIPAYRG